MLAKEKIYHCMCALAAIDGRIDPSEYYLIEKFSKKIGVQHTINLDQLSKKNSKEIENFFDEGLRHLINISNNESEVIFDLFHHLRELAQADNVFHSLEKKLIDKISAYVGNEIVQTKENFEWSKNQNIVLGQKPSARTLVEAPPGAGKTELVAERVFRLITEQSIPPKNIFLVSFTNTAVYEMKHRIFSKFSSYKPPWGLNLSTLDKNAFQMNATIRDNYSLEGNHEINLQKFLEIIEGKNYDFMEDWNEMQHLLIDEAQDFHGLRRDVCMALINALPESAGITILGDPCQQIYGWESEDEDKESLLSYIDKNKNDFEVVELSSIHRTSNLDLIELLEDMRAEIYLNEERIKSPLSKLDFVEFNIKNSFSGDDYLFLFRTNDEVSHAAYNLSVAKKPFRIRTGSSERFEKYYKSWIADLFEYALKNDLELLSKEDFENFCNSNLKVLENSTLESKWDDLRSVGSNDLDHISLNKVSKMLSSSLSPAFLNEFYGFRGPKLSTIHASKGTQSPNVLFKNFTSTDEFLPNDDEAKVVFVGISRAKNNVKQISNTYKTPKYLSVLSNLEKRSNKDHIKLGRKYRILDEGSKGQSRMLPTYLMEIGLKNDFDPLSIVHIDMTMDEAIKTQNFLKHLYIGNQEMELKAHRPDIINDEFFIECKLDDQIFKLGKFHHQVCSNMKHITYKFKDMYIPALKLDNFQMIDIGTFFYDESKYHPDIQKKVLKPFRDKKFWLIPIFYSMARFRLNNLSR